MLERLIDRKSRDRAEYGWTGKAEIQTDWLFLNG